MDRLASQVFTIPLFAESHAAWGSARYAIVDGARRITYGELNQSVNRIANALRALGVRKGDAAGLVTGSCIEHLQFMLGALKVGAVVAPVSAMLKPETCLRLLQDAEVRALLVEAESPLLAPVHRAQMTTLLPGGCVVLGDPLPPAAVTLAQLCEHASGDAPPVQLAPEDDCSIIYSSGTTGVPKGIVHSHLARSLYGIGFAAEYAMDASSVSLLTTPPYSNGSWMLMLPTLYAGGTLVLMPRFSVETLIDLVVRLRVTHSFLVPTQIEALLAHRESSHHDLSSLRAIISAGSKLRDATKERLSAFTGRGFFEIYGNTEGVGTLLKPAHLPAKLSSVGPPAACGEIRIIDDMGRELPPGTRGEIVGRNPFMSRGYFKRPDLTAELAWHDAQGRLFVRSGDIGALDEDGFLYVVDRKKDMILSGGFNVYASDIEAVLVQYPGVRDAAVVAAPHDKWGETPYAFVEVAAGATVDPGALSAWANARLEKHQRLGGVSLCPDLPRNALQKVLKAELKASLWQQPPS